ncbi:RNA polymerase factor sigma-54 [Planococcus salinus]|uniref:RNA polymerase sigma-54 factor n=1 Tax=Planococcus salinus TaxID=1848460 RepID=A0A3M8P7Z1_9BACL|nr:RNA polymerase factor sigma-54 [Planococcus salinus]RNF39806.1 RNA polymerase sigma-54 factor [Planococcus salinus]
MNAAPSLQQNMSLKINMTPDLQQSLVILKYSTDELMEYVESQLHENPLLDISDNTSSMEQFYKTHSTSILKNQDKYTSSFSSKDKEENDQQDYLQNYNNNIVNIEEYLWEQVISLKQLSCKEKSVLKYLIRNLDENGFLTLGSSDLSRYSGVPVEQVEEMIGILQKLEPAGIGAKDFQECLLLQLKETNKENTLVWNLIQNNLKDIAERRYRNLAKQYKVSLEAIQKAVDQIKLLNPRPINSFNTELTQYVVPDIIVEKFHKEYVAVVNDKFFSDVSLNSYYENLICEDQDESQRYLKDKYKNAVLLLKGLEHRHITLYRVAVAIIEFQIDFFENGYTHLKPMKLEDIATKLGLHESTVSRATSNKYIQTPHGLFRMKELFTRGIESENQVDSNASIKEKLKKLIAQEDKKNPFSDQKLLELLAADQIKVARRTIAKYREELGILCSSKRVRY